MIANYHTHTYRCRHAGSYTDREYVEAAIRAGYGQLGFSDHAPIIGPWDRPCMLPESLPDYVQSVLALKEEYADQITIFLGLEAEYVPDRFDSFMDTVESYPFDYLILGQHDIFGQPKYIRTFWESKDPEFLDIYCNQCADGLRTGVYSYWAHPDVFHFTGDPALFEERMRQMCRLANSLSIPLELNLTGVRLGFHYPNPDFWRIVGEEGCQVIYGCDAHSPMELWDTEQVLKTAYDLTERFNLQVIEQLSLRKPIRNK